jgi:hypothetical protein
MARATSAKLISMPTITARVLQVKRQVNDMTEFSGGTGRIMQNPAGCAIGDSYIKY